MAAYLSDLSTKIIDNLPINSTWTVKVKNPLRFGLDDDMIDEIKKDFDWTTKLIISAIQYAIPEMIEIADFDTFVSFNGNHSSQIVKNAVEKGEFRSVNKIIEPDKVVVELAKGGYRTGIEETLNSLKEYQNNTRACVVITPFGVIKNLNLIGLDYNFTIDNGSNLLVAKLTFQEILYGNVSKDKKAINPGTEPIEDMGQKALQGV